MRKEYLLRVLALLTILCGGWWTLGTFVRPIMRMISERDTPSSFLFSVIILPMMSIPGVIALLYGMRLFKITSKENIKGNIGALAIFSVFLLAPSIRGILPDVLGSILSIPMATIIVIPLYVVISKRVIEVTIEENIKYRELVGKRILLVLSFMVYSVLHELIYMHAPIREGYDHIKDEPWDSLSFIGPIIAACVFYRVFSNFIKQKDVEQANPSARLRRP